MTKLSAPSVKRILKVIDESTTPLSGQEIAKRAYVSFSTFKNHALPKLSAAGLIHQSGWEKYAYGYKPAYSAGQGKTPPRPPSPNSSQRCRDWRERTAKNQFDKANRRLATPDPITAALMGIRI